MSYLITRRTFLGQSTALASTLALPHLFDAQVAEQIGNPGREQPAAKRRQSPNGRLNVACIGVGGQGRVAIKNLSGENFVAFCDVDEERAAKTFEEYPSVPRFNDYRKLFDKMSYQIDAVTISTPDHMHFPIAMAALQLGKHVFMEKPLTHTISEARQLAKMARESKVATQMGNQGHAGEGVRLLKEWIADGILGEVRQVHSWISNALGLSTVAVLPDHSKLIPVVPPTLNWDAWLGVAAERAYDPVYVPGTWRRWWSFGNGLLGDWGCHQIDGAFYALDLGAPSAVQAMAADVTEYGAPMVSVVTYEFPARGKRPAVKYTWSDGGLLPTLPQGWEPGRNLPDTGTLIYGSKATVLAGPRYVSLRIVPETRMKELVTKLPPKTIPRVEGGPIAEWIRACKGGPKAGSNFEYAGPLTETVLLGTLAQRTQRRLEWDAANMRVTNLPEANQYLTKTYRRGWL